jgi:hypothetical protein
LEFIFESAVSYGVQVGIHDRPVSVLSYRRRETTPGFGFRLKAGDPFRGSRVLSLSSSTLLDPGPSAVHQGSGISSSGLVTNQIAAPGPPPAADVACTWQPITGRPECAGRDVGCCGWRCRGLRRGRYPAFAGGAAPGPCVSGSTGDATNRG